MLALVRVFAALLMSGSLPPTLCQTADTDRPSATDIEIQFWSAAQHGPDVAGYRSHLMLFPGGKFASLARLRAGDRTAPPDSSSPYRLTARPYVAANGTPTHIVCTGFGAPSLFDHLVDVASGTPAFGPTKDNRQWLYTTLPRIQTCEGAGLLLPAMPPGSYEARYLSRTSTPDESLQVLARAGFLSQ